MFEKEAEEYANNEINKMFVDESEEVYVRASTLKQIIKNSHLKGLEKANEWHYVKDGDLPRQYKHTCFSIEALSNNKKWVYYEFGSGKWFCGNKEVKVIAWKEIELPKECEMTDDLYYRKLESTSTSDLVDMLREKDRRIAELEEENAELKEQCSILADCDTCYSPCKNDNVEMKKQLIKAKEIIGNLLGLLPDEVLYHDFYNRTYVAPAEKFIREIEL